MRAVRQNVSIGKSAVTAPKVIKIPDGGQVQIACSFARHTSNMKCRYDTESTKKRDECKTGLRAVRQNVPTGKSAVTAPKVIKIPD